MANEAQMETGVRDEACRVREMRATWQASPRNPFAFEDHPCTRTACPYVGVSGPPYESTGADVGRGRPL